MIQIVNGDFSRFDKKVIIYSRLKEDPSKLFSIYATTDKDDMKRKILEVSANNNLESIALSENFEWVTSETHYDFLGIDYGAKSESDLLWGPTCVVFAGEHPTLEDCRKHTLHGLLLYFGHIADKKTVDKPNPVITHEDIPPENLIEYITKEYINAMYHAIGWEDKIVLNMLKQRFAIFSFGTSFYQDARNLFEQIQRKYDPNVVDNILFTIAMKNASDKEDFELAAKFRDRIKV